jgi:hypothetical protein
VSKIHAFFSIFFFFNGARDSYMYLYVHDGYMHFRIDQSFNNVRKKRCPGKKKSLLGVSITKNVDCHELA